jgi:hypothetical protein
MKYKFICVHLYGSCYLLRRRCFVSPYGQAAPTRSVPVPPMASPRQGRTEEQRLRRSRAAGIGLTTGGTPTPVTCTGFSVWACWLRNARKSPSVVHYFFGVPYKACKPLYVCLSVVWYSKNLTFARDADEVALTIYLESKHLRQMFFSIFKICVTRYV